MPYIPQLNRKEIITGRVPASRGELNFYIYRELLRRWNNHPRYDTLHDLTLEFILRAKTNRFLTDLAGEMYMKSSFAKGRTFDEVWDHIMTASCRAVGELERRYGDDYEDAKIKSNGDIK